MYERNLRWINPKKYEEQLAQRDKELAQYSKAQEEIKQLNNALMIASEVGDYDKVVQFLADGANIHADDDCTLCLASHNGHTEVVKLLLERGANVHADNDWSLCSASENGHLDVVKLLLEHGANIHAHEDYALRLASERGYAKVVKLLKERIDAEKKSMLDQL